MKKQSFLATLLVLVTTALSFGQDVVAPAPAKKPPVIELPPVEKKNVAKFDAIKAIEALPWHVTQNKAPEAWAINPKAKGKGVRAAIIDTGCQVDHPALGGKVVAAYNAITKTKGAAAVADGNGHGTHCAGGVHAIAPEADLIVVKVLSDQGSGSVDDIAHGIDWAVTEGKADVLNLSLGGSSPDDFIPPALDRATKAGVLFIAAAGNAGGPQDTEGYPGRYPQAFSVAAASKANQLASFSSWGPNVVTTDYGVDILGPLPGNQEGTMSGTSMATPLQAGKATSWVATHPEIAVKDRPAEFRKQLIAASPFKQRANSIGYGLYTLDKITRRPERFSLDRALTKPTVGLVLTIDDLTADARAKILAAGFDSFSLQLGKVTKPAEVKPVPVPVTDGMQPVPNVPPGTPLIRGQCPPGGCPVEPQRWEPFGGRFRIR